MERIELKYGKKYIQSKPFDYECMCILDDNKSLELDTVINVLKYLFNGTIIRSRYFKEKRNEKYIAKAVKKVIDLYIDNLAFAQSISKNSNINESEEGSKSLRELATTLFKAYGTMPSELATQNPKDIFRIISSAENEEEINVNTPTGTAGLLMGY